MNTELLKFKSLRWPKPPLLSKRALLHCMYVLFEDFYNNKASHFKQRQLSGILCHCFTSLVLFLPSYYTLMYFIEEFAKLSVRCVFCRNLAKRLFSSSFYTTVVSDGLHEPYLLLTSSSFILILSDSYRGCLIWVRFVEIPKQNFVSQLNVIYLYFVLW